MRFSRISPGSFILIAVVILAGNAWADYHSPRLSTAAQNHYRSNIYTRGKDPYAIPQKGEYTTVTLPIRMNVNTPALAETIALTFNYRCHGDCPELWLELDTPQPHPRVMVLLQHPFFTNPSLPFVTNNQVSLYQKRVIYPTITAFLNHPPAQATLYADRQLLPELTKRGIAATALEQQQPQGDVPNFILTSYQRPRLFADWFEFSRQFRSFPGQTATFTLKGSPENQPILLDITTPIATVPK